MRYLQQMQYQITLFLLSLICNNLNGYTVQQNPSSMTGANIGSMVGDINFINSECSSTDAGKGTCGPRVEPLPIETGLSSVKPESEVIAAVQPYETKGEQEETVAQPISILQPLHEIQPIEELKYEPKREPVEIKPIETVQPCAELETELKHVEVEHPVETIASKPIEQIELKPVETEQPCAEPEIEKVFVSKPYEETAVKPIETIQSLSPIHPLETTDVGSVKVEPAYVQPVAIEHGAMDTDKTEPEVTQPEQPEPELEQETKVSTVQNAEVPVTLSLNQNFNVIPQSAPQYQTYEIVEEPLQQQQPCNCNTNVDLVLPQTQYTDLGYDTLNCDCV